MIYRALYATVKAHVQLAFPAIFAVITIEKLLPLVPTLVFHVY